MSRSAERRFRARKEEHGYRFYSHSRISAASRRSAWRANCAASAISARSCPARRQPLSWPRAAPKGLVLAGGTGDPGAPDARSVDADVFTLGLPVLAMGYGARQMALTLGGQLLGTQLTDRSAQISFADSPLFEGLGESERFFSRVDSLELPEGFGAIAFSDGGLVPAFACEERKLYALQFYAEANDPDGLQILANFAGNICGCEAWWSMEAFPRTRRGAHPQRHRRGQRPDRHFRRRRFGGLRDAFAPRHRRSAQMRLHRHGADAQGRAGAGDLHVPRGAGHGIDLRGRAASASSRGSKALCSPAAKREVVEREVMAVFEEEARAAAGRGLPGAGHHLPGRALRRRRGARPDSRSAWSLCACCSRMKCGSWATCWACPRS